MAAHNTINTKYDHEVTIIKLTIIGVFLDLLHIDNETLTLSQTRHRK